jgi:hypothetical protein
LLGVRVFAFELEIRGGNSAEHTAVKIAEVAIGYLIGSIILKIF